MRVAFIENQINKSIPNINVILKNISVGMIYRVFCLRASLYCNFFVYVDFNGFISNLIQISASFSR